MRANAARSVAAKLMMMTIHRVANGLLTIQTTPNA